MAEIAPLTPLRYADVDCLSAIVAPPYDVISEAERTSLIERDARNVVRLILPRDADGGTSDAKYDAAAKQLDAWRDQGVLIRDEAPAYYRFDQSFSPPNGGPRVTRSGFLALVKLVPFSDRIVLPHERTLSGPKEDRLKLFRATRTNLSPGFMLYRDPNRTLDRALATATEVARFTTQAATEPSPIDNVVSKITDPAAVAAITAHIAGGTLLIADGHHRYETALHYARETEAGLGTHSDLSAEHRYFMSFLCNEDDPSLLVFPTHRLVHGISGTSFDEMLTKVADAFEATPLPISDARAYVAALAEAGKRGPALVAIEHKNGALRPVLLTMRASFDAASHPTLGERPAALRGADVAILHAVVLEHALGISLDAQAKQKNLVYLKDAVDAVARIEAGEGDVLFLMNATPVAQVRAVAEEGEVMPQKATYFYPKVLTGLAIHTLDPARTVAG